MTTPSLDHDASPEGYAAAMVLCQGYAPACSDAEECAFGGLCLSSSGQGYKVAHKALLDLRNAHKDPHVFAWIGLALSAIESQYRREIEMERRP